MEAEIISVGTEIILGQIVNTNAPFLSQQLGKLDITAARQLTVPDQLDLLETAVRTAWQNADLVFVCGGLGPTADDVTLRGVAAALGVRLTRDEDHWAWIRESFRQRQEPMMPENVQQAMYLSGGTTLANPVGLALGSWYERDGRRLIVLPGPPREFTAMVNQEVLPRLKKIVEGERQIVSRTLNFFGRPESLLMDEIAEATGDLHQVVITSYVQPDAIQVRMTVHDLPEATATALLDRAQAAIVAKEEAYFFGVGDDCSLAAQVVELLKQRHLKVTAAESLTGGMFQSTICSVPGASNVFDGGFVTYAASAKERLLGIDPQLIERYGVVSSQTAAQMAEKSRQRLGVAVGIGFTGVAGPDSLEGQPAGTVWVGLSIQGQATMTRQLHLGAYVGRQQIRRQSVQHGLQMIYHALQK
ncbi:competence/damage-inducible protein A [Limosilactobacillus kribbianus]|uniref:competence/damage-inducible protein A n=1 Tax=Limosilactobacillus kribbianus TaxID=2982695 RepID=UPI002263B8F0|nr:competence/damage-inducible protein A [Limosilactobacillus kribbianus]